VVRILIVSDDMSLEDAVEVAKLLRQRFEGDERHVDMFIDGAGKFSQEEAKQAVCAVFEGHEHWIAEFTEGPLRFRYSRQDDTDAEL